ncbi:MAG: tetratricopeptide repeat protein [Terracidiphilus sp.]
MRQWFRLILTVVLSLAAEFSASQTPALSASLRENALALERQGDNAAAEAAWKLVLNSNPSSPEAYAHMGLLEARQEHYKEAVPLYRKALELGPQLPSVQLNLGLALFKGGELKQSIEIFEALIQNQPADSPQVRQLTTLLGMAHYGLGEYALAIPYLKDATASDARNKELKLVLAHSCLWSKQNQCVLDVYHEILALDPNSAEAYMLAGEALDGMKDRAGAIQQYQAAVKANPKEPGVHWNLGYLLWAQSRFKEAAAEFQAELINNPDDAQSMTYLADAEIHSNQFEAARQLLEKAMQINSEIALTHLDLGIVYSDAERRDDALRELKLAEQMDPSDQNVHWRLGHLYQLMGDKDDAKAEFDTLHGLKNAIEDDLYKKLHDSEMKARRATDAPAAAESK